MHLIKIHHDAWACVYACVNLVYRSRVVDGAVDGAAEGVSSCANRQHDRARLRTHHARVVRRSQLRERSHQILDNAELRRLESLRVYVHKIPGQEAWGFVKFVENLCVRLMWRHSFCCCCVGSSVTVNCVLPGIVNTGLYNLMPFRQSTVLRVTFAPIFWFFSKTSYDGAQTPVHVAIASEEDGVTGKIYK